MIGGTVIVLAVIAVAALELTNTTHIFHSQPSNKVVATENHSSKISSQPASPAEQMKSGSTDKAVSMPPTNEGKYPTAPPATSSKNLQAPSVSSTFASQYSNVDIDQELASTCLTNSGVDCYITFTNGSISKSLPKKTTDAGGSASWAWTPKSVGLTPGTWTIKATSTYNGQSKSTSADPLKLEIKS